jgi:uncharacterized membrane protein YedE/YeeE
MQQYFSPLLGGMLIGLSASFLLLTLGRVAGVSGIVGSLLVGTKGSLWRLGFVIGLVAVGALALTPGAKGGLQTSPVVLLVAGLLVGFGTRLGNGCTSGHGVCGLSRLSRRSAAATGVFIGTAALTVLVVRHFLGVGT